MKDYKNNFIKYIWVSLPIVCGLQFIALNAHASTNDEASVYQLKREKVINEQSDVINNGKNYISGLRIKKRAMTQDKSIDEEITNVVDVSDSLTSEQLKYAEQLMLNWGNDSEASIEKISASRNISDYSKKMSRSTNSMTEGQRVLPGTVWYATLENQADSYVPGPVLVELQEGPYEGGKLLGQFNQSPDGAHLILEFSKLSWGNRSLNIHAIAVDANSDLPAVKGEVDYHIFRREILPFAVDFLAGAVGLISNTHTMSISAGDASFTTHKLTSKELGLGMAANAANKLSDRIQPEGPLQHPQVKLSKGSDVGILVLEEIIGK